MEKKLYGREDGCKPPLPGRGLMNVSNMPLPDAEGKVRRAADQEKRDREPIGQIGLFAALPSFRLIAAGKSPSSAVTGNRTSSPP